MKLSVVIVAWKVKDRLQANLAALFKSAVDWDWEVFVVDNNSGDGTTDMVRQNFPQVKLIVNQENLGFAAANNQAIKEAAGDFVLLLNPDMKVFADTLAKMVAWQESQPQAWVAGCRLVDEQGKIIAQVRRFPRLSDQLAIVLKLPHLFSKILDKYLRKDFDYNKAVAVDSLRGSFFMIRRGCLDKIGLLDERFFVWFEEVDYCRRVWQAGGEVWYTPTVKAVDYVGQSFKLWPQRQAQAVFRASQLKYFSKWHKGVAVGVLTIAWWPGRLINWLGSALKIKTKNRT